MYKNNSVEVRFWFELTNLFFGFELQTNKMQQTNLVFGFFYNGFSLFFIVSLVFLLYSRI
jgi:hypothetical protein